jgi:hypothetical protein
MPKSALKLKLLSQRDRWSNFWYLAQEAGSESTVLERGRLLIRVGI